MDEKGVKVVGHLTLIIKSKFTLHNDKVEKAIKKVFFCVLARFSSRYALKNEVIKTN
jgi:hypothetical protein